jgi:hypothetical protein
MTRTSASITALGLLLASAMASKAEGPPTPKDGMPATFTVISPIFGQLVSFSMPSSFVAASENTNGPNYMREAVLKGETVQQWTQMITVTGVKGLAGNPDISPQSFAGSIAGGFKKACPDSFATKGFGATKFGDQEAFVAVIGCGRVGSSADEHSETALIVAVKGSADYYTLQWAERAAAADTATLDETKWHDRLRQLMPIRFCAVVPGEAAPYPSCVGKN